MTQMESAGAEVNVREPTGSFTNLQVKEWATLIIIALSWHQLASSGKEMKGGNPVYDHLEDKTTGKLISYLYSAITCHQQGSLAGAVFVASFIGGII